MGVVGEELSKYSGETCVGTMSWLHLGLFITERFWTVGTGSPGSFFVHVISTCDKSGKELCWAVTWNSVQSLQGAGLPDSMATAWLPLPRGSGPL
jgi:hypothetical protein